MLCTTGTPAEVVEINQHEIDNIPKDGGTTSAISGIYRWVEKVHEVQLRHYGTRMMIEFSVPEPALSVLGLDREVTVDVPRPDPLNITAADITEGNDLALARKYEAVGVKPPPDVLISVGFTWSSQPDEKADDDTAEDTLSQLVAIPEEYRPVGGHLSVSALPSGEQHFVARFQIGDKRVSRDGVASFEQWFSLSGTESWPGGVPVSMTAHGHFDKTLSLNVSFVCLRRKAAWTRWQIATFEAILAGYQKLLSDYNEAVAAFEVEESLSSHFRSLPEAVNRRTEREQLQKWSTKILRRVPFDFDAVVKEGANDGLHDEVDPARADQQAPLIRFYEGAFEWENMSYFFHPYFWGRRRAWRFRQSLRHEDHRFETFLRAGAARVVVPVTPGYQPVLDALATTPTIDRRVLEALRDVCIELVQYLGSQTTHTSFNLDDRADYIGRAFPRAISGAQIHDCGVYADWVSC